MRPVLAEFLGTSVLVATIVGSGHMADALGSDRGTALMLNMTATVLVLAILVALLAPISGAHFNPAVSVAMTIRGEMVAREGWAYIAAQLFGAISGTLLAQAMFEQPLLDVSQHERISAGSFLGEVLATAGLLSIILLVAAQRRGYLLPLLVPAWIGAGYLFTSSTAFANPAVSVARMFTDSFSGIQPTSVPWFILAQAIGAAFALILFRTIPTTDPLEKNHG